jgi:hypothetical protein
MRLARQAAIEKLKAKYILLECGDYTTLEALDTYRQYSPKRGYAQCEICNKWVKISNPPMRPTPPQEPMF